MHRFSIALLTVLCLALAASTAQADQAVTTTLDNQWSPSTVNVGIGEKVTWTNSSMGFHNLVFDDGSLTYPAAPDASAWTTSRTFPNAGTYKFHCGFHGKAMSGSVVAQPVVGGVQDTTPPDIDDLKVTPSTFCNKKTKVCKTTGAEVDFTVDEEAYISGRIIRLKDNKTVGKLNAHVGAGDSEIDLAATGYRLGKYRLELTPKDRAGNKAPKPSRVSFRISTKRGKS
jgi:plastocyanin